jgi:UDP-N-acetylmuramyl pentapeptide phosphotransferase/UDP-N-acetylglucosamine-1-phosphate transferase
MEFISSLFQVHFPDWLVICAGFILSLAITWRSIPTIIDVARLKGLNERPNCRSSHKENTPLLGGMGVFAGFILSTIIIDGGGFASGELKYFTGGLIILFFIGLKDDILVIDPRKKLAGQIMAALVVILLGDIRIQNFHGFGGIGEISYIASVAFTLFVFVVITNGFNLIDGIDGLASGIATITSIAFGAWFWFAGYLQYAVLCSAFAGSLIAFFRFNVFGKKNKIFLGDTGSLIIGFTMSVLVVRFLQYETNATGRAVINSTPVVAIGILIVPLFDTLRVFIIRVASGHSPFKADKLHIHHLLLNLGYSHLKATMILMTANVFFIVLVLLLRNSGNGILLSAIIILATSLSLLPKIVKRKSVKASARSITGDNVFKPRIEGVKIQMPVDKERESLNQKFPKQA